MEVLSDSENLALGGVTAFVIGVTLQPTLYWKNAAQQGMPFTVDPRVIYRGLGAALSAEIGAMGLQFLLTGYIKKAVLGGEVNRGLTPVEEVSSALVGGALSALYTSPVELAMIQQQNFGGSLWATAKRVARDRGPRGLGRGLATTMLRDACYTAGLLGATPAIQTWLVRDYGMGVSQAGLVGSAISGVICATLSCPLDAAKTCIQGDLLASKYTSTHATLGQLFKAKRLFGGVGWRVVNITLTIMIANEFRVRVAPLMFPSKFKDGAVVSFKHGH